MSNATAMNPLDNYLNMVQISVLRAAIDRIIPPDDFPGGWDAGVGKFFAQLLTTETQHLLAYQRGLNRIRAEVVWLRASGAENVRSNAAGLYLSGGQHQTRTCRMCHNLKTSVTDIWSRIHGHDN